MGAPELPGDDIGRALLLLAGHGEVASPCSSAKSCRAPTTSATRFTGTDRDSLLCSSRLFLLREPPRPILCGAGVTTCKVCHTSSSQPTARDHSADTPLASRTARREPMENSSEPQKRTLNGPRAVFELYLQAWIVHCRRAIRTERSASIWTCSEWWCSAQALPAK